MIFEFYEMLLSKKLCVEELFDLIILDFNELDFFVLCNFLFKLFSLRFLYISLIYSVFIMRKKILLIY